LPGGDFEAVIAAPRRSRASVLLCMSQGDDIWIRFGSKQAFYSVDTPRELVSIVRALLSDEVHFAVLSRDRKWSGTTLVRRGSLPAQGVGESARIISWSGKFDRRIPALGRSRPARPA
jgi:uncharacterized protein YbbC (DUF1343 family)